MVVHQSGVCVILNTVKNLRGQWIPRVARNDDHSML